MPAKKHLRSKAKERKEMLLDTIRRMRESRMQEIRASVPEGPGTTRGRFGYGPFCNRGRLVLFRSLSEPS